MNVIKYFSGLLLFVFVACGSSSNDSSGGTGDVNISFTPDSISFDYKSSSQTLSVSATTEWGVSSSESWCTCSPSGGIAGTTTLSIKVAQNDGLSPRTAVLTFKRGTYTKTLKVTQKASADADNITAPDGYALVWHDEFNAASTSMPSASNWSYETGGGGWGNNELQYYVSGVTNSDTLASVSNGTLKIKAKKINGTVYSIRMNTSTSWTYGYFEARLKLPSGKGTWPAFWMLPKNFTSWPADGEIDIMEEVGYNPNYVSSSIHCTAYNHTLGTQKTASKYVTNAESEFHVYAVEWTASYIKGFVDGVNYFTFLNDGTGNKDTWPFNAPFYLKLNLAWGGDWGGAQGVDESALPLTYEVDYVRVFQK